MTMLKEPLLQNQLKEQGYTTRLFPSDLRILMLEHIERYIRSVATPFLAHPNPDSLSLEEAAAAVPDATWGNLMTRAFRIFPMTIAKKLSEWADRAFRNELGVRRTAINVVYPQEVKTNSALSENNIAVYWRCVRPGKPDAGRAHRDASFWDLEFKEGYDPKVPFSFQYLTDIIKIWIPLKGCVPTSTLQIIPKSHRMEIPTTVEETEYGRRPGISSEWLRNNEKAFMSPIELSQGSCILFDMNLVHRGPVHHNPTLRISAELNFIVER